MKYEKAERTFYLPSLLFVSFYILFIVRSFFEFLSYAHKVQKRILNYALTFKDTHFANFQNRYFSQSTHASATEIQTQSYIKQIVPIFLP